MIQLHKSDALTTLRGLPDQSAQCAVTSPPFYGLRSYDVARWTGGDPACGHVKDPHRTMLMGNPEFARLYRAGCKMAGYYYDTVCEKCGTVRERELGHKETVGEFVRNLVGIFREMRRVLANDGVFWLNINDSYARKNLYLVPQRLIVSLQEDGWFVRRDPRPSLQVKPLKPPFGSGRSIVRDAPARQGVRL